MRFADLHLHTHHSDGTRSPREVIDLAAGFELGIIAISDHDNIAAYDEIRQYAAEREILLVPAAELSAEYEGRDVHLLAYAFDPTSAQFVSRLEGFREARQRRGMKMVERLNQRGFPITAERVEEIRGAGAMGRPHVARALVEAGFASSVSEAFAKFLHPGGPGYVSKERFSVGEAVDLVHSAGGVVSIAHPTLYRGHQQIVPLLLESGIDAVEVFHPDVDESSSRHYRALAETMGKFVTGGSDDHGTVKKKETIGTIRVAETFIRPVLERAETR